MENNLFRMEGNILIPGSYSLNQDGAFVNILESVNLVGRIDTHLAFPSKREIIEYGIPNIEAIALYDDGKTRFMDGEFKNPNELLHIALTTDLTEWIGDDWPDATRYDRKVKTALIFNKTLENYIKDETLYEETLKRSMPGILSYVLQKEYSE